MAARAGMVSHASQHPQYSMAAAGYGDRYAMGGGAAPMGGVMPSAGVYQPQQRQQGDEDDGEIVNRRALARAESEKSKSKKKRKREGDDDDDEDFTGFDDVDWHPGKKGGKHKKRHLGWDDSFSARSYPIPAPTEHQMTDPSDMGDSLVATRPRRERRATLKYREALDSDDEDGLDDAAYESTPKRTPRAKGRQQSLQSNNTPGAASSASGSAAVHQFSPRGKASSSSLSHSMTADDEDDEMYGFEAEKRTQEDGELDDEEGHVIDKVLDYREYIDDESVAMNMDGSIEKGGVPRTKSEIRGEMNQTTKVNKEYRIKWRGLSYRHCTWESYEALQSVKGTKKLENYVKAAIKEFEFRKHATREELEPFDIEQEMLLDLYDEHLKVDRVIAVRTPDPTPQNPKPSPEYLCVWSKLPYVEATWERADDIIAFQSKIDQYLGRSQQQLLPRTYYGPRVARPSFREVQLLQATPTEWLKGGILRDYQLQGINWLVFSWCNSTNCILADEMGLGKTIQTISFLGFLQFRQKIPGPFLIVVPLSTIANWESEFAKWLPDMNTVVYMGDSKSRELIREHEFYYQSNGKLTTKFNALVTSYEIILKDKQHLGSIKWNYLAVDEAHRLKNSGSALHEVLNEFTTSSRLLITGTPLQNSLKELWALLNFLEPRFFPSLEVFERDYSTLEGESQLAALHQRLKPHVLRRFKSQVEKSLPAKNERILRVGMAPMQRKYYRWVITRNFAELNRGLKGQAQSTLSNIVVELKKVCNHPFLYQSAEEQARSMAVQQAGSGDVKAINELLLDTLIRSSGKLMLLDKLLVRLKETGHRVLIFSQMVRMLDLLGDYLRLRGFLFQRLDGSMTRSARQMAMESFNAEGSKDFCFILSTRAGGLGINLSTADTVIIFDSDWNPQNDLQAQSRAHRIGQKHVVNIYRLLVKDSVEEDILEKAKKKLVLDHLVIQRMSTKSGSASTPAPNGVGPDARSGLFTKGELADIIRFGAEELFKSKEDDQFDPNGHPVIAGVVKNQLLDDMDIDDILARAEPGPDTVVPGMELLSAFKVASFDTGPDEDDDAAAAETKKAGSSTDDFWDRIVPIELRSDRKASEMIVTGPRARKKRIENLDLSSEMAPSPVRSRSRRAATGKASEILMAAEGGADIDHLSAPTAGSSATGGGSSGAKKSAKPEIHHDHMPLLDDEEDDGGDDDPDVGAEDGGNNKKKRKRSERRKPSGEDEMDSSDVRKMLVAIRAIGIEDMEKLIQQSALTSKRPGVVEATLNAMLAQCQVCLEEAAKAPATPALNASGTLPGDDSSKSVGASKTTIKFMDVSINATQLLARINDLADLNAHMAAYPDPYAFRLSVIVKPWTNFTSIWSSPVDDAMLLLGVHLYGLGQWQRIQQDTKLGLQDKILGPGQPSAAQLPNRVESLFKVLRDAKEKAETAAGGSEALEMPKKAKRERAPKPKAESGSKAAGPSSSSTTPKSKPKSSKASAKKEAAAAAAAAMEDQVFPAELESHVSALWTTNQPTFAAKYRAIVAIENEEEKLVHFRQFIGELRQHILLLVEISASMPHAASFSQTDLVSCLWAHASIHICESSKTGKWLQAAGDQLATITLSITPPPILGGSPTSFHAPESHSPFATHHSVVANSETTTSSASTTSEMPSNLTPQGPSSWTDSTPIAMPATLPPIPMIMPRPFEAHEANEDSDEPPNHMQFLAVDEHLTEAH
jgi:SNF2 family DNA or RNA helicase